MTKSLNTMNRAIEGGMTRSLAEMLSSREGKGYSIVRAAMIAKGIGERAGIEVEVSNRIAEKLNRDTRGIFIPTASFGMRASPIATSTGTSGGANLVGTELAADVFISALRPRSRVLQLGATVLPDLVEDLNIPRTATGATAGWVGEGSSIPEGEGAFDRVSLTPHTVGGYVQLTRTMAVSITPQMEQLIRGDIAKGIGSAIDAAAVAGSGTGAVPAGVLNQVGIGSVALGTNGGAVTYTAMEDLEAAVTEANVDGAAFGYLTTPAQVRKLRGLVDSAGRPVWMTYADPDAKPSPGHWNGHIVVGSNNVPANLTKGTGTNLSAILFGLWSDLLIADWGFLELRPNPYGVGFASGTIELLALAFVDIGVRHGASFAAITDAT